MSSERGCVRGVGMTTRKLALWGWGGGGGCGECLGGLPGLFPLPPPTPRAGEGPGLGDPPSGDAEPGYPLLISNIPPGGYTTKKISQYKVKFYEKWISKKELKI